MSGTHNTRTADILAALANDDRRLRVGQKLPEQGEIPWELVERVRDDLSFMVEQPGITAKMVMEATGISKTRYCRFGRATSRDSAKIDIDRITRQINVFLETVARRNAAKLPEGFVRTQVAERMLTIIGKTIELSSIGVIYADAGRGKSMTLEAAVELYAGSVLLRVRQHTRTPTGLAKAIGKALQVRGLRDGFSAASNVIQALKGTGRCLLIDEAHQLKHESFELLRDIHDEAGVPIILAGTLKLNDSVNDHDLFFGQMSSRIALRYNVTEGLTGTGTDGPGGKPLHSVSEIVQLYERGKVRLTGDGRMLLTRLANLPGLGGLRLCAKVVQVAWAAAMGEGKDAIDAELLLKVVRAMNDQAFAVHTIEPAIQASTERIKIA
ncbi:MAG: ATP-binding protein [Planctomycetota bacterium]